MALDAHLAELHQRHQRLEKAIEEEMKHPGTNELRVSDLKRQKLKLKDEMNRLNGKA